MDEICRDEVLIAPKHLAGGLIDRQPRQCLGPPQYLLAPPAPPKLEHHWGAVCVAPAPQAVSSRTANRAHAPGSHALRAPPAQCW